MVERDWKGSSLLFKLGDRVKIRHSEWRGPIVEWRGPLGPDGAQIYRVLIRRKPSPAYIEVREDQLRLIPPKASPPTDEPGSSSAPPADRPLPPVTG